LRIITFFAESETYKLRFMDGQNSSSPPRKPTGAHLLPGETP
jgi:hypothetical protein